MKRCVYVLIFMCLCVILQRHCNTWDHRVDHFVPTFKEFESKSKMTVTYDLVSNDNESNKFLFGHIIQPNPLFPATGHITHPHDIHRHIHTHTHTHIRTSFKGSFPSTCLILKDTSFNHN